MAKYVPDISNRRWVVFAPNRVNRPIDDLTSRKIKGVCQLCPGNEEMTPPEVFRIGKGEKDKEEWQVRVVPNKFPVTDIHEVIIHSPSCDHNIEELSLEQIIFIFQTYRERFNFHRKKGQVIIFCNSGERSGASLKHPHSQLVVIPAQINLDTLSQEPMENMIMENTYFNVYCPDFSQWPYEVWIAPKVPIKKFGDINDEQIKDLAAIMQKLMFRLKKIQEKSQFANVPFSYNYYIYPKENWYLRLIPRFINRAGFELGTGLQVNIIDPEKAAKEYKGFDEKMDKIMDKLSKIS